MEWRIVMLSGWRALWGLSGSAYSIAKQHSNNHAYEDDDHVPYHEDYEAKARLVGERLEKQRQENAKLAETATRKLFDSFYGDWTHFEIKRNWNNMPYSYQKEYERRKKLAETYDQLYGDWSNEMIRSKLSSLPEDHREEYHRRRKNRERLDEICAEWRVVCFDNPAKISKLPHGCYDELLRWKKSKEKEELESTDKKPIKVVVKVRKKR